MTVVAPPAGEQTNQNVFALFEAAALAHVDRPFLIVEGQTLLTYRQMLEETTRAATWLGSVGARQGERVLVQAHKSPAAVILYLACLRAGVVFIPLNTAYQESELSYFLGDAEPALLVASPKLPGATVQFNGERALISGALDTAPWASIAPKHSRPSALPRMIPPPFSTRQAQPVGRRARCSRTAISRQMYRSSNTPGSGARMTYYCTRCRFSTRTACSWPYIARLLGASPILFHERFDAVAVLRDLPSATVFMGVPTFYTRLLAEQAFDEALCANIRLFISGSAPLLDTTFEEFRRRTGKVILERYGMTEALMITSNLYEGPRIAGSVGLALPGISIRVVDERGCTVPTGEPGVLEIKGPNLFAGYWRNPEKTAEDHTADGYFITGDIATKDENGVIRIVGRAKDLIISGGYNVYPKEIELAIDALGGVAESAVIGVPHPDFGEGVVAIVARTSGKGRRSDSDLQFPCSANGRVQTSEDGDHCGRTAPQRDGQGAEGRTARAVQRPFCASDLSGGDTWGDHDAIANACLQAHFQRNAREPCGAARRRPRGQPSLLLRHAGLDRQRRRQLDALAARAGGGLPSQRRAEEG